MTTFVLMVKGFIIGIAFVIPGVSGGTLALYLGVYHKMVHAIGHIFDEFKKSMMFLLPIVIGIVLSVVSLAKLFGWFIRENSLYTLVFFVGLLLGGLPGLYKKAGRPENGYRHWVPAIIGFTVLVLLLIWQKTTAVEAVETFDMNVMNFLLIMALGTIGALTMIVPGISGSALLLALGYYTAVVTNVIGNVFDFSVFGYNVYVISAFGVGVFLGIMLFSRLIDAVLNRWPRMAYMAIIGLVIASVAGILLEIKDPASAQTFAAQTPVYKILGSYFIAHYWQFGIAVIIGMAGFMVSRRMIAVGGKHQNRVGEDEHV